MCRDTAFYEMIELLPKDFNDLMHVYAGVCVSVSVCVCVCMHTCICVIIFQLSVQQEANHAGSQLQATPLIHLMICNVLSEIQNLITFSKI